MLHDSSFDSMNHFVQDKFQSTNFEDKFKHIHYMSTHTHGKKKTYPQHILQTHRKHIQNIKSKQKHIQTIYSCSIFDMLYKYFFPCTHHKRNIFHFLIVAFPLGGPPARTSGRQNHWDTPGFQVKFDVDPTGDATARGLRPNRRSSGQGLRAPKPLGQLGFTSTQRETQRLEDFDPTGEAPGRASGRQSHWDTPGFQVRFDVDPTGDATARGLRPNRGSSGQGLRAPKPLGQL